MNNLKPYFVFVNKPVGMSSTDVVRYFKYNLPRPVHKIGHIGTLDPFAEGLLMIGVNGAQKANDLIHDNGAKTYVAYGILGVGTTTGDHTGEITRTDDLNMADLELRNCTLELLTKKFQSEFIGEYFQKPHRVSAVKVNGKRLYEYEREGVEVEVKPVRREIFDLEILEFDFPRIVFRAKVSSGTYIRVLFEEMAEKFKLSGHLTRLVREKVGEVDLGRALDRDKWPQKDHAFDDSIVVALPDVIRYPFVTLNDHFAKLFKNGVRLRVLQIFSPSQEEMPKEGQRFWVYNAAGDLLGLLEIHNEEIIHLFNFSK